MLATNEVPCPCCKRLLYRTRKNPDGPPEMFQGPPLQTEKGTPFVVCPHCSNKIPMRLNPGSVVQEYDLAPQQPCQP